MSVSRSVNATLAFSCFLLVTSLFEMALERSAKVLASVPEGEKAVMCVWGVERKCRKSLLSGFWPQVQWYKPTTRSVVF